MSILVPNARTFTSDDDSINGYRYSTATGEAGTCNYHSRAAIMARNYDFHEDFGPIVRMSKNRERLTWTTFVNRIKGNRPPRRYLVRNGVPGVAVITGGKIGRNKSSRISNKYSVGLGTGRVFSSSCIRIKSPASLKKFQSYVPNIITIYPSPEFYTSRVPAFISATNMLIIMFSTP